MQKFTRPITREIEVKADRIACTFDDKGLSFRLVGSRRQPVSINWPDLISLAVFQGKSPPTPEDLDNALASIGGGKKTASSSGGEEVPSSAAETASPMVPDLASEPQPLDSPAVDAPSQMG